MVESILREFVEEEEETSNDGIGISFILMEILLLVSYIHIDKCYSHTFSLELYI